MKTYSAAVRAALSSGNLALVQMAHMAFPSGTIALNQSTWNLTWAGVTYSGAYGLGAVSQITDKPGEVQGVTLQLNGGDPLRVALALDGAGEVQGTPLKLRTALIETSTYTILDAPIDWTGKLDTMSLSEDGDTATISVTAESSAVDLLRGTPSAYSDADQKALYATDKAFEFLVSQAGQRKVWPAREYFLK